MGRKYLINLGVAESAHIESSGEDLGVAELAHMGFV